MPKPLLTALAAAAVLLAFCQVAAATAASSFTVKEVDKAGATVQIGTWTYDAVNHTLVGAPFVQALSSTDFQGAALPYVPFSGQDAFYGTTKLAVATRGVYLDDLAAWVAGRNGIPLGGATAFNVTCADTGGSSYFPTDLTLAGVSEGRYWYPSYNYVDSGSSATWDVTTRMSRKALLAILSSNARRTTVSPSPTGYTSLLAALGGLATAADDVDSMTLLRGQLPGDSTETNLGGDAARWIDSLTFKPAYRSISVKVAGGGGAATVATDDAYLKAAVGEPVSFTVGGVTPGYEVDAVTVTDAGGVSVPLAGSAGQYSFTMPASAATIAVRLSAPYPIDLSAATIAAVADRVYTGSPIRPALLVTYAGLRLVAGVDYGVAYTDNTALGKATATVTGMGDCTGSGSATFRIVPRRAVLRGVKAGRGAAIVTWRRSGGGVSGYKVAFRKKGARVFKSAGATRDLRKVVRRLKRGDTYVFRVCAYKVIDGKARRGAWSRTRTVSVR